MWFNCSKKNLNFIFSGATFHIPLTKSATLNRLLHWSLWRFSGAFYFRGLCFAFRGWNRPEPVYFSPVHLRNLVEKEQILWVILTFFVFIIQLETTFHDQRKTNMENIHFILHSCTEIKQHNSTYKLSTKYMLFTSNWLKNLPCTTCFLYMYDCTQMANLC